MNFGFSEEQELLRQEVRKLFSGRSPIEGLRRVVQSPQGYDPELWKELAELGFLGLGLPERYGGAGLSWEELTVLLEESGRVLFPGPLISTLIAGSTILDLGSATQQDRWLPGLADGSLIGTLAPLEEDDRYGAPGVSMAGRRQQEGFVLSGVKRFVQDAESADLLLVPFRAQTADGALQIAVIERQSPGVELSPLVPIDASKRLADLRLGEVEVANAAVLGEGRMDEADFQRVLDRGAAAVSAESVGAMEAALDLTVQFSKERIQFGSPIGRYQSVKHPLAEIYVDIESGKSLLYYAVWALDCEPAKASLAVSEAKAFVSRAFSNAGIQGVQLHGAVGYTEEYDVQLFLKRSKWARAMWGDEDYHHDRIAALEDY